MKITTVLCMDAIEPSLEFWTKRLGFEVTVSVPHGGQTGFAILTKGTAEVMLQTHASIAGDAPELAAFGAQSKASLFIEVDDFPAILEAIEGYPVTLPIRTTFYGMQEIGVLEPGGNLVVFACSIKK